MGHLSRREKTEGGEAERWRNAEGGETKGRKCGEKMGRLHTSIIRAEMLPKIGDIIKLLCEYK